MSVSDFQIYARQTNAAANKLPTSSGGGANLAALTNPGGNSCATINADASLGGRGAWRAGAQSQYPAAAWDAKGTCA